MAYIGDAVYELMVRSRMLESGNAPVNALHKKTVSHVCASAQARGYRAIEPQLTEEEAAVYRRGRNTHNNIPKNADPATYRSATGLEALFGYLYVSGRMERAQLLFDLIWADAAESRGEDA
jgi:ribonuclease-3 family protein